MVKISVEWLNLSYRRGQGGHRVFLSFRYAYIIVPISVVFVLWGGMKGGDKIELPAFQPDIPAECREAVLMSLCILMLSHDLRKNRHEYRSRLFRLH